MRFCVKLRIQFCWFYPIFLLFGPQYVLLYIRFISFEMAVLFHYNIVNEEKHNLYRKRRVLWSLGPSAECAAAVSWYHMHRYVRVRVLHSQPSSDTLCCCPNVASVVSANILC